MSKKQKTVHWDDCILWNVLKYVDSHVFLLSHRFLRVGTSHLNERITQKMGRAERVDAKIMNEKLIESKGVLSGGALLDVFSKDQYNDNLCDVDIYFQATQNQTPLEIYLESLADRYCCNCHAVGFCQNSSHLFNIKKTRSDFKEGYNLFIHGIERIINIYINGIKYQLIYLQNTFSIDSHINSFDYRCLHNSYNGKQFSINYRCDIYYQCARKVDTITDISRRSIRIYRYLIKGFYVLEHNSKNRTLLIQRAKKNHVNVFFSKTDVQTLLFKNLQLKPTENIENLLNIIED